MVCLRAVSTAEIFSASGTRSFIVSFPCNRNSLRRG
jgi:hypothetical protein